MSYSGRKVLVCLLFDIDNTLLSGCRRFPAECPWTARGAGVFAPQHTLSYYDSERGRYMRNYIITTRPHLGEFLHRVSAELSTTRVAVQVGLFTRNTPSYANAIAEQVLRPLMPVPLAFKFGSTHCCGPEERKKPLAVTGFPATSLLVDDTCASFIADEFFSGRGALVAPFFSGLKPWGLEEEMDDVLSCGGSSGFPDTCSHGEDEYSEILRSAEDENSTLLCALIEEFVAFWHNNSDDATDTTINLLKDPRAARYQKQWSRYHAPFEERLVCIT
ncbi:hypothetical protein C3747_112g65 [Trypanosoma cruzi]|uniref:FCP1 homology domain-containing protein n=2 Tax=Trypanosoma cruzi TaxID=5693 RepID=Q4E0W7_TRYCC|nr:hypothetical protein Tc00.1047053508277.310 [Trypanosoma cruzi]EAN98438.1 hypothetical protein Tc00.1047053508277.310 [Trypanosoma cruzi]PWV06682.1 hypothetical protein C3747_112g65 [Trypanosoma cruzi]RNC57618.1 hypothetical protein TcCL_ESM04807 [Trypanosoma cruzi]|eukprot:XP_820289.1 hypothetical protein [Trypanosoma cruzi strain CL Brener]